MRLAPLLAELSAEDLQKLRREHLRTDEALSSTQLCVYLESAIRSSRFLADFVINRQPPTFSLLGVLLEAADHRIPLTELRERVAHATMRIREQLDSGEILARDGGLRIYRQMVYEARRSDNDINASEASLLGVYRREHGIALVTHFLLEHHGDLREFWMRPDDFDREFEALRAAGVVFQREGDVVLPQDIVPGVFQALGLDMPPDATKRLLAQVNGADMADVLERYGAKSSGSRAEREARILDERIQASAILDAVGIGELKDICRHVGIPMTGNKEEIIARVVTHFAAGRDLIVEVPPPAALKEPRRLDEARFKLLFGSLKNQELVDILRRRDHLRQAGSKDQRVSTLWDAHISEASLLGELMNRDLEDILQRVGLKIAGSKPERIERLIAHFGGHTLSAASASTQGPMVQPDAEVSAMQEAYRQHSSAGQQVLQEWLEGVLGAPGLIRCYATEVSNPTQQLKNKLSQAASAKNGLLVLALADQEALTRAEVALTERWAANDEWSKSVACVALSHPVASSLVEVLIERTPTEVARQLRSRVFPRARLVSVISGQPACSTCGSELPQNARFCPSCGAANALKEGFAGVLVTGRD